MNKNIPTEKKYRIRLYRYKFISYFQIWASSFLPNEPNKKDVNQKEYFAKHGRPMLMDYVNKELDKKVFCAHNHLSVFVQKLNIIWT